MTPNTTATEGRLAYESGQCERGDLLRPGGIELTVRAILCCGLMPGARVLDVGCGAGTSLCYLQQMLGLSVTGIDTSASAYMQTLAAADRAPMVQGDATSLPFATASMDAVIAECTLSLIEDKQKVLAECARVVSGPGRLAITDMYARNPQAVGCLRAFRGTCVSGMIVREELETELASQGFQVEMWEDHSDVLKQLLFRIVMEDGSLQQLWTRDGTKKQEAERINQAMRDVRPGYFLLIAVKKRGMQQ